MKKSHPKPGDNANGFIPDPIKELLSETDQEVTNHKFWSKYSLIIFSWVLSECNCQQQSKVQCQQIVRTGVGIRKVTFSNKLL